MKLHEKESDYERNNLLVKNRHFIKKGSCHALRVGNKKGYNNKTWRKNSENSMAGANACG